MKSKLIIFSLFASILLFFSCSKNNENVSSTLKSPKLPNTPYNYSNDSVPITVGVFCDICGVNGTPTVDPKFPFGSGLMTPLSTFNLNNDQVELGRVLFYDKALSINNSISCGSCHHQKLAFSDNTASSIGFGNEKTPRNSFPIVNCINSTNLFWDSRSTSLQDLALRPIQNHIEMGMEDMKYLKAKLSSIPYYKPLFEKAFNGDGNIDEIKIANSLSSFVGSLVSSDSKFDHGRWTNFSNFTNQEKSGFKLFNDLNCTKCHAGLNFTQVASFSEYSINDVANTANIGLDINYKDKGKSDGKFKIPSLRNIALTAPYMHDGRFATLEEVVEHYNSGVKNHPNLDKNLKDKANGNPQQLNLNEIEKRNLVAFLKTLTDEKLTKDIRYSDPFVN